MTTATPSEPRPNTNDDKLIPHFDEIGAVPDRIVAAKAGVALNTVRNFRAHYGIPSSRPTVSAKAKKPARKAKAAKETPTTKGKAGRKSKVEPLHDLVGTMPDEDLAAKAGAAVSTVESYRRRHGIPAYAAPGEVSGDVLPPEAGSTPSKPSSKPRKAAKGSAVVKEKGKPGRKSKIKPFHDLVGTMPDEELAKMAGAAASTVENYRRKNKIPAFASVGGDQAAVVATPKPPRASPKKPSGKPSKASDAPKGRPGRKSKVAPLHDLMGAVPDDEVAAKAGVKVTAVQAYRRKHGIPAFEGGAARAKAPAASTVKAATKAAAPKATSTTRWGWRVTFANEQARLVIASSAGEAVEAAAQSGLGEVVQVERLIEALG